MNGQRATVVRFVGLYAALLILLALNMALTVLDAGRYATALHLSLAAASVLLVGLIFMRLRTAAPLLRLAAVLSLLWVTFLFVLTFADYLTR